MGKCSDNEKQQILAFLRLDLQECTPGFFNRALMIVKTFSRAQNIDQLLYMVREGLVQSIVPTLIEGDEYRVYEAHIPNQVSKVAKEYGLGVNMLMPGDPYTSSITCETIKERLQDTFDAQFTPFNIPFLICDLLRTYFIDMEFYGAKEERGDIYTLGVVEKVGYYLSKIFPQIENPKDWFLTDSRALIIDFNWRKFRQMIFKVLSERYYCENSRAKFTIATFAIRSPGRSRFFL